MSSTLPAVGCETPAAAATARDASIVRGAIAARLADYLVLCKPRIALLALVTVSAGYALASADRWQVTPLIQALAGIALVAAGSSALNQYFERASDALMRRTADRPLPAGRLAPAEVLFFGVAAGSAGLIWLAAFVNAATAVLAAVTLLLYAAVYTPLKRQTALATAVGAVPGALPPVLGWAAAGAPLDTGALSLFAILFLWQFPHFLAIAWIYREEYARAGLKMLPARGRAPRVVGILAVGYALALVPASALPWAVGLAGRGYAALAIVLSLTYLAFACRFALAESTRTARGLLWSSLVYLPLVFTVLVWDHFRLLS